MIVGPPAAPVTISSLPCGSSTIVGSIAESMRLPGRIAFASPCTSPNRLRSGGTRISISLIQHGERRRFAMPIPLRADFNAGLVRAAAKRSKDGPQARRLLALAAIYDGGTRPGAAESGSVHRLNKLLEI